MTEVGSQLHDTPTNPPQIVVIYVEDNPAILESTSMLLELEGFDVKCAADRNGALAHVAAGVVPDVIVADYDLADSEDGVQVIDCIRTRLSEPLPAIIITGDTTKLSGPGSLPGRVELICKPPERGELAAAIRALAGI